MERRRRRVCTAEDLVPARREGQRQSRIRVVNGSELVEGVGEAGHFNYLARRLRERPTAEI
jgi:hypothetical protein